MFQTFLKMIIRKIPSSQTGQDDVCTSNDKNYRTGIPYPQRLYPPSKIAPSPKTPIDNKAPKTKPKAITSTTETTSLFAKECVEEYDLKAACAPEGIDCPLQYL